MKKILSVVLVLVMLVQFSVTAEASQPNPRYINTEQATATLTISDAGNATVRVTCSGNSNVTRINITVYLEKKVGTTWQRVSIGTSSNMWTYSTTLTRLSKSFTTQLSTSGEYRTVVKFVVSGTTSETITKYSNSSY